VRNRAGNQIGWSRAPVIPVHDLRPGQSKTIDYYPHGHLSVVAVDKLTVEIEPAVDEEDIRFFRELQRPVEHGAPGSAELAPREDANVRGRR
jgi:hypothetical protein